MFSKAIRVPTPPKESHRRFRVKGKKTPLPPLSPPPPPPASPPPTSATDDNHAARRAQQDEHDRELSLMLADLRCAHNTLCASQRELREARARAVLWQAEAATARSATAAAVARNRLEVAALQHIIDGCSSH